jgi:CubicO group peptidase (beta-lactamase class C family)
MIKEEPKFYFALILVLLAWPIQFVVAQEASLENQIDEVLSNWNNTETPGAAVAYVEGGKIVFSKAYGLANLEHRIGWTTDTVSDLGSVSKQFIGFAFAMLAEQGKLALNDDIRIHLPQLPDFGETITIKHLFNHTSGLREIYNTLYLVNRKPGDIIFQEDAQTLVQYQEKLQFSPGSRYLYNNTEYMLLADIVEVVTGQQFHEWMTDNVFVPLGMLDTQIMHRQGQVIPRVASSYVRESDGQFVQRYDNSTLQGGGGIYSTVEDMAKWIANFSSHQVGTEKAIELLTESGYLDNGESLDYGLGIGVVDTDGVVQWSHGGSSAGYRSFLIYLPEHERGFIFVTNTPSNGAPGPELTEAFLSDVLELPEPDGPTSTPEESTEVPLENPSLYTGRYLSDELEAFYSILLEGDKLILSHRWLGSYEMSYLGNDQFDLERLGGPISFTRDSNDEIEKFILDNGRTIGVEFRRID